MEMEPYQEPVPIELKSPELELAWKGLCYSMKAGFMDRDVAVQILKEWDETTPNIKKED